jgi:hypothetical protein
MSGAAALGRRKSSWPKFGVLAPLLWLLLGELQPLSGLSGDML